MTMAKRFTDTTKWNEDWFLDLSISNKLFWIYICDNVDHAGIFKPNKRLFELLVGDKVNIKDFLNIINGEKERIKILENGRWYLTKFIEFQYGSKLNPNNRVHKSILKLLDTNNVNYIIDNEYKVDNSVEGVGTLSQPNNIKEVQDYFVEKLSNKKEGQRFYYFYESKGWKVGNAKMKNWKMAASGWIARNTKDVPDASYLDNQLKNMQ